MTTDAPIGDGAHTEPWNQVNDDEFHDGTGATYNLLDVARAFGVELGAVSADQPIQIGASVATLRLPGGDRRVIIDAERYDPAPRRAHGTVRVLDGPSFVAAVRGLVGDSDGFSLYADDLNCRLVAVLNDDLVDEPGWRDHRVEFEVRFTPEWQHWTGADKTLLDQERFAEHIEDGLEEIVEPAAATMLELAQTFHATTSSKAKIGSRLRDGRTQVVYEEDIDASAGSRPGEITIPQTFTLNVRPFLGADKYQLQARLRFRLQGAKLALGYKLVRPHDVVRDAFGHIVAAVGEQLPVPAIAGTAPDPVRLSDPFALLVG